MSEVTIADGDYRVGRRCIELARTSKLLFPRSGITKRQLIEYYERIAGTALPHYRDRPASLQRFPDGLDGDGFFQKDKPDYFPDWIAHVELAKKGGTVDYVLINEAATLVYLANQACITPHLALSRADRPHRPDRLVFDLDPSTEDFGAVVRAARRLRALLDELELPSFVQTTGSRGLHVVAPLRREQDFDPVRDFAHDLARLLAARHPDELTVEQRKNQRGQRIFLDYLRNAYGQTAVAPYAVRAIEHAPVATPLDWDELGDRELGPRTYTVANLFRRLGHKRDPWHAIDREAGRLGPARRELDERLADAGCTND